LTETQGLTIGAEKSTGAFRRCSGLPIFGTSRNALLPMLTQKNQNRAYCFGVKRELVRAILPVPYFAGLYAKGVKRQQGEHLLKCFALNSAARLAARTQANSISYRRF